MIAMSWRWRIIAAVGACIGYEALNYTLGVATACVFVGLLLALWVTLSFFYRRRLLQLRQQFSELPPEDQSRVLKDIDPEIAADLQKGNK